MKVKDHLNNSPPGIVYCESLLKSWSFPKENLFSWSTWNFQGSNLTENSEAQRFPDSWAIDGWKLLGNWCALGDGARWCGGCVAEIYLGKTSWKKSGVHQLRLVPSQVVFGDFWIIKGSDFKLCSGKSRFVKYYIPFRHHLGQMVCLSLSGFWSLLEWFVVF